MANDLIEKIKELEEEIKRLKSRKKYGLVWEDKPEDVVLQCERQIPVLKEIKNRKIVTDNTSPTNLLIEGDNYHALSVLNYTHKGKIDVIYIDPPYNTGNKDFIYNDDYVDREDSFRHSKWLSFMEKRLRLAKDLLKDSGVIFISIDDNEQAQLKLLCDSVFGENSFVSNITVETGAVFGEKSAHVNKTFVKVKDYVLVYSLSRSDYRVPLLDRANFYYDSHFNTFIKENKRVTFLDFLKQDHLSNQYFKQNSLSIKKENIEKLMILEKDFRDYIYNDLSKYLYQDAPYSSSNISEKDLEVLKSGNIIFHNENLIFMTNSGSVRRYIPFSNSIRNTDDYISEKTRSFFRGDLWKNFNEDNKNIQDEGGIDFNNGKKPIRLMSNLIKWSGVKNGVVLDFFAGSGSTGHAVLSLNKQDGGNRQFILCTNNGDENDEHKICEEKTYPRLKNVIDELGGNLEYLKCEYIDKTRHSDNMKMRLMRACSEMLCLKENTFNMEKEVKDGDTLMYRMYSGVKVNEKGENKKHIIGIYYDIDDSFLDDMRSDFKIYQEYYKTAYIFSLAGDDYIDDYRKWNGINIEDVPEKILEIYETIYKRNNRR